MPRTALTITPVTRASVTQPAQNNSDVANGNYIPNNTGGIILEVSNTNAATRNVTIAIPTTVDGLGVGATNARVITVGVTPTVVLIGPFPPTVYNQSDGSVNIDCTGAGGDLKFRAYQVF